MAGRGSFTVGGVFRRMAFLLDRHGSAFGMAALVMVGLPALLTSSGHMVQRTTQLRGDATPVGSTVAVVSSENLVLFLAQVLFNGFVIATAFAEMRGERPDALAALRDAWRAYLPLLGIALLDTLGIGLGLLCLLVPGAMLFAAWAVVAPTYMAERRGIVAAFGRSRQITAGHRWPIFGLGFLYVVASLAVTVLGVGVLPAAVSAGFGLQALASAAVSAALALAAAVGITAIYIELRLAEDGSVPA